MYNDQWFDGLFDELETPNVTHQQLDFLEALILRSTLNPMLIEEFQKELDVNMSKDRYFDLAIRANQNQPNLQQLDYVPGGAELTRKTKELILTKR